MFKYRLCNISISLSFRGVHMRFDEAEEGSEDFDEVEESDDWDEGDEDESDDDDFPA
jgi:hypothetical protein